MVLGGCDWWAGGAAGRVGRPGGWGGRAGGMGAAFEKIRRAAEAEVNEARQRSLTAAQRVAHCLSSDSFDVRLRATPPTPPPTLLLSPGPVRGANARGPCGRLLVERARAGGRWEEGERAQEGARRVRADGRSELGVEGGGATRAAGATRLPPVRQ